MNSLPHIIACPHCHLPLQQDTTTWRCDNGHSYDNARQGYLNLLLAQHKKSKAPGDTQAMVDARQRVLDSQLYQPISDWLNQGLLELIIAQPTGLQIADIGCGEGYYTQRLEHMLQDHQQPYQLYGVDISKEALKRAAKRSDSIHWLVASGGQLPFVAHSLDLLICLFTNLMPQGFSRALKPGATVVLLNTGVNHLIELRQKIYQNVNMSSFSPVEKMQQQGFILSNEQHLNFKTQLHNTQQIIDLLQMTPHWWKINADALKNLQQLDELNITVDIMMHQFTLGEALA